MIMLSIHTHPCVVVPHTPIYDKPLQPLYTAYQATKLIMPHMTLVNYVFLISRLDVNSYLNDLI